MMYQFTCSSCGHTFTRYTNVSQPLTIPCAQCPSGMMTAVVNHEEDDYYGPLDKFIQTTKKKVIGFFKK